MNPFKIFQFLKTSKLANINRKLKINFLITKEKLNGFKYRNQQ